MPKKRIRYELKDRLPGEAVIQRKTDARPPTRLMLARRRAAANRARQRNSGTEYEEIDGTTRQVPRALKPPIERGGCGACGGWGEAGGSRCAACGGRG